MVSHTPSQLRGEQVATSRGLSYPSLMRFSVEHGLPHTIPITWRAGCNLASISEQPVDQRTTRISKEAFGKTSKADTETGW
jgi:hypothetical protein